MQYWSASHLLHEGRFDVLYGFEAFNAYLADRFGPGLANHAFLYPPLGMFLDQPLRFLAYLPAYFSWCVVTRLLYLAAVGFPDWSRTRLLLALLAPTSLLIMDAGQNGLLSGALFIAAMRLLDRRPVWSGILLGILSFKPHLGLLIPFALLAGRLWIPLIVAFATVLILAALSLAIWGADPWIAYIEQDAVSAALAFLEKGAGLRDGHVVDPVHGRTDSRFRDRHGATLCRLSVPRSRLPRWSGAFAMARTETSRSPLWRPARSSCRPISSTTIWRC